MLELKNIEFSYNNSDFFRFQDFSCEKGANWLITGPSGCGKTTLLHLMAGLLKPQKGSIKVNDNDITTLDTSQVDRIRGKNIGIVFQKPYFISSLNVCENVEMALYFNKIKKSKAEIIGILNKLGIGHKHNSKPQKLSQGEQQRLSIARAIINKPSIILADEPTSSLDDTQCNNVMNLLIAQAMEQNASLIVVTHDLRVKKYFQNVISL